MTKIPRPRAVIFDWDNTLVDTWPVIHEALHNTFAEVGRTPWTLEEVKQRVARSMRDYFPELFGDKWQEVGQMYRNHYAAIRLERLKEREGASDMLAGLSKKPLYLAVASNKEGKNLRIEAAHLGWEKYFGKLIGAGDTPRDKPAPDPIIAALSGSNIAASSEVWFVGDSELDMECAAATGCTPIFYGALPQKPLQYPFVSHVNNHRELSALFDYALP
jgi:phosphoglycolate phosphatase